MTTDKAEPLRVQYLKTAQNLTRGDRDLEYGKPYNNLTACGVLFEAYLCAKFGGAIIDPLNFKLTAEDVAWLNVLQKMARTFAGNVKPDTYIDAAAYAAIAGECAEEDGRE